MKNLLSIAILFTVLFTACTKETHNYNIDVTVENVEVSLDTRKLVAKVESSPFLQSTKPLAATNFEHLFPTEFKAYFVVLEAKGSYTQGQVVKVLDVIEGANTVVIPALKYRVIVSNYDFTNTNNLLNQNRNQLPERSTVLYLYGDSDIDYVNVLEGTVEVTNDYAALEVKKNDIALSMPNDWIESNGWFATYVRNKNGGNTIGKNVQIPVVRMNGDQDNYNSSLSFPTMEANKIHRIIFTENIGDGKGGNLIVNVQDDILKDATEKTVTIN